MSNAHNLARLLPNASGQLPDASMSGGSVIQVVSSTSSTRVDTSSTSYVDTGLSVSITPINSQSKIAVFASFSGYVDDRNSVGNWECDGLFGLYRGDSNQLIEYRLRCGTYQETRGQNIIVPVGMSFVDAPSSTSVLTYKVRMKVPTASYLASYSYHGTLGSICAMEIAA